MTQARTNQSNIFAAAFVIVVVLSGCSDPRFKQEQAIRDARITRLLNDYAAHDAAGVDRIHQTLDAKRELDERRSEHLTYTCGLVRARYEYEYRRWNEDASLRQERLGTIFRGKPDQIPDTWARMFY